MKLVPSLVLTSIILGMGIFGITQAFALESNTAYFIDSESMYIILIIDPNNKVTVNDVGITVDGKFYELDETQLKVWRATENGDKGRIFGKTLQGDYYYTIYEIDGETAKISTKLWHNGTVTRIIETALVEKLF